MYRQFSEGQGDALLGIDKAKEKNCKLNICTRFKFKPNFCSTDGE